MNNSQSSGKKISPERKSLILAEAVLPGCSITKLAKLHGISRATIYSWIKDGGGSQINKAKANKSNVINSSINSNINDSTLDTFIEVDLINSINDRSYCRKSSILQKASFIFNDFSIVIEGDVSTVRLLKVLKVLDVDLDLEEVC